jgi:hypothetical protein
VRAGGSEGVSAGRGVDAGVPAGGGVIAGFAVVGAHLHRHENGFSALT